VFSPDRRKPREGSAAHATFAGFPRETFPETDFAAAAIGHARIDASRAIAGAKYRTSLLRSRTS
jgi:hypothetical protein